MNNEKGVKAILFFCFLLSIIIGCTNLDTDNSTSAVNTRDIQNSNNNAKEQTEIIFNPLDNTEEAVWVHRALKVCSDVKYFYHDINKDGKYNDIDTAVMFYAYYTSSGGVAHIKYNTELEHTFVEIYVKNNWHAIDTNACKNYVKNLYDARLKINPYDFSDYYMKNIWNKDNKIYSFEYDEDVTMNNSNAIDNAKQLINQIYTWRL